jgi:transaldolase
MTIKIYADGADLKSIIELNKNPVIDGMTTNPSLMKKAGVKNYKEFAKEILSNVTKKPISFEVIGDDWETMSRQAKEISSWGKNVFVKIPFSNTEGISMEGLVKELVAEKIKVNLTAIFTYRQIDKAIRWLGNNQSIISIFAGRIADGGYDPTSFIAYAKYNKEQKQEILWASTRERWNIQQAEECGADIITVGHDILKKVIDGKKDLEDYSIETIKMFNRDATESGLSL